MDVGKFNIYIKKMQSGDKKAIEKIYKIYFNYLKFHAYKILKSAADAEDIVSELFSHIINNANSIGYIENPRAWLTCAITNNSVRFLKNRNRQFITSEFAEESFADTKHEREDLQELLAIELQKLTIIERKIFKLHYLDGYKYAEIGEIINYPVNTIKTIVSRMKVKLSHLKKYM